MGSYPYPCEATCLEGFVQRVVVLAGCGYYWFVHGRIPDGKKPEAVDRKLIEKYGLALSEPQRYRRRRAGQASVQYVRFERTFVLLATRGEHRLWREERDQLRDLRRTPLRIGGYSISVRRDGSVYRRTGERRLRVSVRLDKATYLELRARFLELATCRRAETLASALYNLPYQPYAPVRLQVSAILRRVNDARKRAGYEPLPRSCVRFTRKSVRQLKPVNVDEEEDKWE